MLISGNFMLHLFLCIGEFICYWFVMSTNLGYDTSLDLWEDSCDIDYLLSVDLLLIIIYILIVVCHYGYFMLCHIFYSMSYSHSSFHTPFEFSYSFRVFILRSSFHTPFEFPYSRSSSYTLILWFLDFLCRFLEFVLHQFSWFLLISFINSCALVNSCVIDLLWIQV